MNRSEMLLTILAEECAEVAQRCSKALRFGLYEGRDIGDNNVAELKHELNDLYALVEMLEDQTGDCLGHSTRSKQAKKEKVETYLLYSASLGTYDG